MKRWISYYCPLIVICILASFGFNTTKIVEVPETLIIMQPTPVLFPKNKTTFTKPMAVPPGLFGMQGVTGFNFSSFLVAVVGAVVLIFVVGLVRR
jgi:hypothetical protein